MIAPGCLPGPTGPAGSMGAKGTTGWGGSIGWSTTAGNPDMMQFFNTTNTGQQATSYTLTSALT